MAKNFEFDGVNYIMPEITFNSACDLAECGLDITQFSKRKMTPLIQISMVRAIISWASGEDPEYIGEKINDMMKVGGVDALAKLFEDVYGAFSERAEESDFLRGEKSEVENQNETAEGKSKRRRNTVQ